MEQPPAERPCIATKMRTQHFARLKGNRGDRAFRQQLGKRAGELYRAIYGERSKSTDRARFAVSLFPYGVLEQAYGQLVAEREPTGAPTCSDGTNGYQMLDGTK